MSYLSVYYSRINHNGETTAERIKNGGIRSFEKWLAESPHTIRNLSVERGIFFDGIILTNKDKAYQKIMFLNVANEIPLVIGDIINWKTENNVLEKWLIFQEEKKVNGTYRTFWIVRCNYLLKWVDEDGHLQQSWSYLVSSVDDKIKGNFRTWHALITPQPNKYAEILMPRYEVHRGTNFIVEEESWSVVEYDHTSVPGVVYLSLTEGKVNLIYDDLQNNIADTNKLTQYGLLVPNTTQIFSIGEEVNPIFTLTANGEPISMETKLVSQNKAIVKEINGVLIAVANGECDIAVQVKDIPSANQIIHIQIGGQENFGAYIKGSEKIRLDREEKYELITTNNVENDIIFTLNTEKFATIISHENNSCIIHANDQNLLGSFILTATLNGINYTKEINIIPLW